LYASPKIVRVIKSRRMRWVGHVAYMRAMKNAYSVFVGKLEGNDHSENSGIRGRIILECILGK
jgi:hypothetical protein